MEVQIGYIGCIHHWGEWLPVPSDRTQPYHSKTAEGHGTECVDAPARAAKKNLLTTYNGEQA